MEKIVRCRFSSFLLMHTFCHESCHFKKLGLFSLHFFFSLIENEKKFTFDCFSLFDCLNHLPGFVVLSLVLKLNHQWFSLPRDEVDNWTVKFLHLHIAFYMETDAHSRTRAYTHFHFMHAHLHALSILHAWHTLTHKQPRQKIKHTHRHTHTRKSMRCYHSHTLFCLPSNWHTHSHARTHTHT